MADKQPTMPGQVPSSFDSTPDFYNERAMQKVVRKIKEEPLVPLGIGLTVAAFVNAYRALRRGDSVQANRMFRARVLAQGFTVVAMVAGSMYYSQDRAKTKELRELKSQRDAEEKRQKWIRELEVRDEEERVMKDRVKQKVASRSAAAAARPAEDQQPDAASGAGAGTGGILGRMGLWPKPAGQEGTKEEDAAGSESPAEADAAARSARSRKENPKSSLGALGELMASQRKDETKGKGKGDGPGDEPKN